MHTLSHIARVLSLILLSVFGTSALMYVAPGYFADMREMDSAHAMEARAELSQLHRDQSSLPSLLRSEVVGWLHGDLGRSRQYEVQVTSLVHERGLRSLRLLASGVLGGWLVALLLAIPLSMRQTLSADLGVAGLTAVLLALPVGLLATLCLLSNTGGPVLVLAVVIAARDLKMLHRILQNVWTAPHVLHAHAQGLSVSQILRVHIRSVMGTELLSVAAMSFTLALSALVPVEVIFDVPGLGQLAWTAAMNRDLPVLVVITALMSACVGVAGSFVHSRPSMETVQCA